MSTHATPAAPFNPFSAAGMALLEPTAGCTARSRVRADRWLRRAAPTLERWTRLALSKSSREDQQDTFQEVVARVLDEVHRECDGGRSALLANLRRSPRKKWTGLCLDEASRRRRRDTSPRPPDFDEVRFADDFDHSKGSRVRVWQATSGNQALLDAEARLEVNPETLLLAREEEPDPELAPLSKLPLSRAAQRLAWGARFEPERVGPEDLDAAFRQSLPGRGWGLLGDPNAVAPRFDSWLRERRRGRAERREPSMVEWAALAALLRDVDPADDVGMQSALAWLDQQVCRARKQLDALRPPVGADAPKAAEVPWVRCQTREVRAFLNRATPSRRTRRQS